MRTTHDAGAADASGVDAESDSTPGMRVDAATADGSDVGTPRADAADADGNHAADARPEAATDTTDTQPRSDAADTRTDAADNPDTPDAGPDAVAPSGGQQYALVGAYLGGISSFVVDPTSGSLAKVDGSPFAAGTKLYGMVVDPAGTFVYATDVDRKFVDGYRLDPQTGVLTAVAEAHVVLTDGSPLTMAMDPKGRFTYVATTGDDAIHGFALDPQTGALSAVAGSPFLLDPSVPDGTVAIDPAGRFLYVTGTDGGIHAFSIDATAGTLSEIPDSPFARTAVFRGAMAFHPSGNFMYNAGPALNAFRVDPATGILSALPDSPVISGVGSDPTATTVAIDPLGRFLYVSATFTTGPLSDTVSGYAIDGTNGALTPVPGSPFAAGPFPYSVAVDRDGRFVYVGNDDSQLVTAFSIDPASGSLTSVADSPYAAVGLQPEIVTVRPTSR